MRKRLLGSAAAVALGTAILALVLSFIPILFPITLGLGVLVVFLALIVLFVEARGSAASLSLRKLVALIRQPTDGSLSAPEARAVRSVRIAVLALIWNVVLYSVLGIHSWLCFVRSFDRELEPLRGAFRVIAGEKVPGQDDGSSPGPPASKPEAGDKDADKANTGKADAGKADGVKQNGAGPR